MTQNPTIEQLQEKIAKLERSLEQAEQKAEQSRKLLSEYAEKSIYWFWETDAEHQMIYLSSNLEALTGISADSVLGTNRMEVLKQTMPEDEWRVHFDDLENRRPFANFAYDRRNKDGEIRRVVVTGWPVFTDDGEFEGYRGLAHDRTEETREAAALAEREAAYKQEIKHQRNAFKLICDTVPNSLMLFDENGALLFANANTKKIHNFSDSEFEELTSFEKHLELLARRGDFGEGDPKEIARERFQQRSQIVGSQKMERYLPAIDKILQVKIIRTEDNGFLLSEHDITELARAREEAQTKHTELQTLLDNLPFAVFWADADGGITISNRHAEIHENSGKEEAWNFKEELRLAGELGELGNYESDAELQALIDQRFDLLFGRGDAPFSERFYHSASDRTLESRIAPLPDGSRIIAQIDISDQVRAELRLQSAVDAMNDGLVFYDKEDRLVISNKAHREHYSGAEEEIGKSFEELLWEMINADMLNIEPHECEEWVQSRLKIRRENDFQQQEVKLKDGKWVLYRDIRTAQGETVGIRTDITEMKKREEQLAQANALLETRVEERTHELRNLQKEVLKRERNTVMADLVSSLCHELRNPLNALNTSLYIIKSKSADNPSIDKALERSNRTVDRFRTILDDLYDFTQLRSLDLKENDFGEWFNTNLQQMRLPDDIELITDTNIEPTRISLDYGILVKAVWKALQNAVLALRDEKLDDDRAKKLFVTLIKHDTEMEITIEDNGIGMHLDILNRAHKPLFSTRAFGVGLGLPICERGFKRHGGHIHIDSWEGIGTKVTMHLPLDQTQQQLENQAA